MIAADQLSNLPNDLTFVFSSRADGTVLDRTTSVHSDAALAVRRAICEASGISYDDVVYQRIEYSEGATYDIVKEVDESSTTKHIEDVAADGLFTTQPGVGLFLPVADCIVTVIYDPINKYLAQLHMGRHSTLTDMISKTVDLFETRGSDITTLHVWMSPALTKAHHRLEYFDRADDPAWRGFVDKRTDGYYLDMQGYNRAALLSRGILAENITISSIDTFENQNYFSHSRGDTKGRFAGLAMMR